MTALEPPPAVVRNGDRPLPDAVVVGTTPRMTPNELRLAKAVTGRSLSDLMGDEADAMQTVVFLKLRRDGYHDVTWEQAGDVVAILEDPAVDPTNADASTSSPHSAGSGG